MRGEWPTGDDPGALQPEYELSVDTGGTFTDGFVVGAGRTAQVKVDTTPADLTESFMQCVAAAAAAMGEPVSRFLARSRVVHFSSTVATNIVVQRSGALVGLVVTKGHEDSLYGSPEEAGRLFGYVDPKAVRGVEEAVGADGSLARDLDGAALEVAVRELLELGVQMVVVAFANAHLNAANEVAAKRLVESSYPRHYLGAIRVLLSSQMSFEPSDYGRTALAVANAYLDPSIGRTLYRADEQLRAHKHPRHVLIVKTDGSSARVAKVRAIDTYNSGPSSGVIGSAIVATALGAGHVVTFDVGGTTTDVAFVSRGEAPRLSTTEFGDISLPLPSVALSSFGLGGGSLIGAGSDGTIAVGPQSAGAVPGPACFGLGGSEPTPTDVWLTLGYLEAGAFLSGRRQLVTSRAHASLEPLARRLGVGVNEAALIALEAIHGTLAAHLRTWNETCPGLADSPLNDRWLFSYGGGGGLLAVAAALALGIDRVVFFPQSSVFSAFGGGLLPIGANYQSPIPDVSDPQVVGDAVRAILDLARRDMRAEGVDARSPVLATVRLVAFAGPEVSQSVPLAELYDDAPGWVSALPWPGGPGKIKIELRGDPKPHPVVSTDQGQDDVARRRTVWMETGPFDVPVRPGLGRPNAPPVSGPAFLAAPDTTVFVPNNWTVEFDSYGYGIARRQLSGG